MYDESSFYSANRLVEFGVSMAVAQQVVNSMGSIMKNMQIPAFNYNQGVQNTQTSRVYYAVLEGNQAGPFSETEIARLINEKKISKETYIWHPGLTAWKTAENIPEILRLVALAPPPIQQ
jgi:hypothetical protein